LLERLGELVLRELVEVRLAALHGVDEVLRAVAARVGLGAGAVGLGVFGHGRGAGLALLGVAARGLAAVGDERASELVVEIAQVLVERSRDRLDAARLVDREELPLGEARDLLPLSARLRARAAADRVDDDVALHGRRAEL